MSWTLCKPPQQANKPAMQPPPTLNTHPTSARSCGNRRNPEKGDTTITPTCTAKPASATSRQVPSPQPIPTQPPRAAPMGRAPALTVRKTEETRPSMAWGVTCWRKVVVLMDQTMGPEPSRKKHSAARAALGHSKVAARHAAAANPATGPSCTARPKGRAAIKRGLASAPASMPAP